MSYIFYSKNEKIRNLGRGQFVCDIIPKWIELHILVDTRGNIVNRSYKIVCSGKYLCFIYKWFVVFFNTLMSKYNELALVQTY